MHKMKAPFRNNRAFAHYTTKHRIVAWISQTLFDNVTYTVRHGLNKGMRRKGGLAWLPEFVTGSAATPEQSFWMNQDFTNLVIYDIGAFHGLLTMFFAQKCRRVISYEPNSKNYARLMDNIRVNKLQNVIVRQVGLGSETEIVTMVGSVLMPGGSTVKQEMIDGLLSSNAPVVSEQVSMTTLDDDIQKMSLPPPEFIKVDVEGGELAVLTGARNTLVTFKPKLFLEMHGEGMEVKLKNVQAIVGRLNELGYREIWHVETGSRITADNCAVAAEGHLYCQQAS